MKRLRDFRTIVFRRGDVTEGVRATWEAMEKIVEECRSVAVTPATFRCSFFVFLREGDILVADILTVSVWHVVG